MSMNLRSSFIILLACASTSLQAQTPSATNATARYMETIRDQPGLLVAFLREMPKGGDLHNHLSGSIYAETFVEWGAAKGACVSAGDVRAGPCDSTRTVRIADALKDNALYGRIVDAWSMRNWSRALDNGHDRFFGTFGKFGFAGAGKTGDMVAEVMRRSWDNHVTYLELMDTPNDGARQLGMKVGWDDDFGRMREQLRAEGLATVVDAARRYYADAITRQRQLMSCNTATAEPACKVEVRFLYQVLRGNPPENVFTQILAGFEVASVDSLVVGFNLVQPEDCYLCMRDFSLHMRMIDYLHNLYPKVKITLHAGELAPGLVPPEGLRFHIRESVEKGHASRIGHGVDVMHEAAAVELLREMAQRDVAVEINLTSNDVILDVRGREHPLRQYRAFGVPTLLSTDDQGVSRSDMTLEYKRAVQDQHLDYKTLKQMARNSIKYSFVQDAIKSRLLTQLDRDFATFEAKWR
jgi:adenosine deaminase